jgi:hypothetical protein
MRVYHIHQINSSVCHLDTKVCSYLILTQSESRRLYIPSEGRRAAVFLSPLKNPSPSAGSEPPKLVFNGKHASYYITEDDKETLNDDTRNCVATNEDKCSIYFKRHPSFNCIPTEQILLFMVSLISVVMGEFILPLMAISRSLSDRDSVQNITVYAFSEKYFSQTTNLPVTQLNCSTTIESKCSTSYSAEMSLS